jgi:hypothetical protein
MSPLSPVATGNEIDLLPSICSDISALRKEAALFVSNAEMAARAGIEPATK